MYKRTLRKMIVLIFLFILYIYVLVINYIPDKITIFEGEDISLKTFFGITIDSQNEILSVSANTGEQTMHKIGS